MGTNYLRRLERLEGSCNVLEDEGMLIILRAVGAENGCPIPWEEPIEAECDGEMLKRDPGEGKDTFMARVRSTFQPPPGVVRVAMVSQGRPPKVSQQLRR